MAEDTDRASKTEPPSGKRLLEARQQGNVPKSPDIAPLATLAVITLILITFGQGFASQIVADLLPFIAHPEAFDLSGNGGQIIYLSALKATTPVWFILIVALVAGVIGNVSQTGFIWAPQKISFNFSKFNPISGLSRLFGIEGVVQFFKSFLKVIVVGSVTYMILKSKLLSLPAMTGLQVEAVLPAALNILRPLILTVLMIMLPVAALDWFWQRYRFMENLKMTKQEVKQEAKDSDGDPVVKTKRRQVQFQRARKRILQAIPKATLIVTNPTHYAVALRYVQGETSAPECVAKGMDHMALKIREIAEAHKIPIIEDPPLARALYATVDMDQVIPKEHFEAVAKIIGFIFARARERIKTANLHNAVRRNLISGRQ